MIGLERRLIDEINQLNWQIETKLIERNQSMLFIPFKTAMVLMEVLLIDTEVFIQDQSEYLLPFGCKLIRSNLNWGIKSYAYDKSDLKQLIKQFPILSNDIPIEALQ